MSNLDPFAGAVIGRGWILLLAFTAALLAVGALRKYCRRVFGAERAFLLWLLLPVAMLASQLPHSQTLRIMVLPPMVNTLASAVNATPADAGDGTGVHGRTWLLLGWAVGALLLLARAAIAQLRYRARLRDARQVDDGPLRWPVLRARHADVGPALIGAWRPCIVLPSDFDQRYDVAERTLILAHESMHARRRDGWWSLCAQIVLALFWFHPLAWLGWGAFRHDQELACDAAVMGRHGHLRRSYANAMLKTQSATLQLPIGCSWSPRHPITERIAMLTLPLPHRGRKFAGSLFIAAGMIAAAGFAYAASQDAAVTPVLQKPVSYQVAMSVSRGGKPANNFTLCSNGAQPMLMTSQDGQGSLQMTVTVKSAGKGQAQIHVDGSLDENGHRTSMTPTLRGAWGQALSVKIGGADAAAAPLTISMTPTLGCGAASASAERGTITESVKDGRVRDVAQDIASRGGYVLVNPQSLDEQAVTFDFKQIPVENALQLIARIDGKVALVHGKQVRFETMAGG
ncbi:MAG TPA: M56 family metallopeptidase [Dyella sp.]|uniref:M56 family metallopeptidase n=1 Tax=Dyella sp. TaxID=1869338 RepID=UPI002C3FEB1E|nr:M56 family metallopeptidase [Dyella sp.]HTV85626.1 M56 family metallopeptidase [Dyella sp.]